MVMWMVALFFTAVLLANVVSGKLFTCGPWTLSAGIVIFPLSFVLTDVLHEQYGAATVRQLSGIAAGLLVLAYGLIQLTMALPVDTHSPVSQAAFQNVFGSSLSVFLASLVAFVVSQLLDVCVFDWFRARTGRRYLWLRATGSTLISQGLDTAVFVAVAFGAVLPWPVVVSVFTANYGAKVLLALLSTPLCYGMHKLAVALDKSSVLQPSIPGGGSSVG
jgi:queuosine precursor transporter